MRIEYGFFKFGKTVYAYMTLVDLFNVQICNYDGDPVIYADVEASTPNNFDFFIRKDSRTSPRKGL